MYCDFKKLLRGPRCVINALMLERPAASQQRALRLRACEDEQPARAREVLPSPLSRPPPNTRRAAIAAAGFLVPPRPLFSQCRTMQQPPEHRRRRSRCDRHRPRSRRRLAPTPARCNAAAAEAAAGSRQRPRAATLQPPKPLPASFPRLPAVAPAAPQPALTPSPQPVSRWADEPPARLCRRRPRRRPCRRRYASAVCACHRI